VFARRLRGEECRGVGFQGQKGIRKRNGESWQAYLIILISMHLSLLNRRPRGLE
jgi:hypothetical protein